MRAELRRSARLVNNRLKSRAAIGLLWRRAGSRVAIAICGLILLLPEDARSQFPMPQTPRAMESSKPLTLPRQAPVQRQFKSTAFFVDGAGHMLTARHAVENCSSVIVAKEGHRVHAQVVAQSSRHDLALLKAPKTLGLAAVFPRSVAASPNDMVFAGAHDTLPGLRAGGGVLANARVTTSFGGSETGHLAIESSVTFGASGAPVLDRNGLVQGVVSRRALPNRVLAVGAAETKSFLVALGVRIEQDDRPQLAGSASRAHRAASISATVTCLQN